MNRILVVDDEIGIRELLKEILEDSGYHVSAAATAAEAQQRWRSDRPELVLLDLSLPDSDGLTVMKSWARDGLLPVPVIILSAYGSIDRAVEATRLGAADFLEKPVTLRRLLPAVQHALTSAQVRFPRSSGDAAPRAQAAQEPQWPPGAFELPYREARTEFERAYFLHALAAEGGNMAQIAERTGIERTHLYRKFKSLGIHPAKLALSHEAS